MDCEPLEIVQALVERIEELEDRVIAAEVEIKVLGHRMIPDLEGAKRLVRDYGPRDENGIPRPAEEVLALIQGIDEQDRAELRAMYRGNLERS